MKLIKFETTLPNSKVINFNQNGLTVIRGDGERTITRRGSSNGTGKTLAAELVSYCLGGKGSLPYVLPDGKILLTVLINNIEHIIERSTNSNTIYLNEKKIAHTDFIKWLDNCNAVDIRPAVTFRSVLSRFLRVTQEDSVNPIFTDGEIHKPYNAIIRNLWLLGFDVDLANSHIIAKDELDSIDAKLKSFKKDTYLQDILATGLDTTIAINNLEEQVESLEINLSSFEIASNYHAMELDANELTASIRRYEKDIAVLNFQRENLLKTMETKPDIAKEDLMALYSEFEQIFQPDILKYFDEVENFHKQFNTNRDKRLKYDLTQIDAQILSINNNMHKAIIARDKIMAELKSKRALDEYIAVSKKLADVQAKLSALKQYHNYKQQIESRKIELNKNLLNYKEQALAYVETKPYTEKDEIFRALAQNLYPEKAAGLSINVHDGNSKSLYDLNVYIESDSSEGVNAARIMNYDWLLFKHGSHHNMGFLWHDNRFFADIDPQQRAKWLNFLLNNATGDKQYILSINNENYESTKLLLEKDKQELLDSAVVVNLRSDKPENKLLGISFDKIRNND